MLQKRGALLRMLAVSAAAVVWALPRFNRADSIFGFSIRRFTSSSSGDSDQYVALVRWFRGLGGAVDAPFAFRPLAPWLASRLPAEPMTALNLVALLSIFLGTASVFAIAHRTRGGDLRVATLAGLLFGLSFQVFYYGATGQIDAVSIGLSALSVALLVHEQLAASLAVFFIAMLAKETSIAIAPFLFLFTFPRSRARAAVVAGVVAAATVASIAIVHRVGPAVPNAYSWAPNTAELLENLARKRMYATFLLGVGIQGAAHVVAAARERGRSPWARLFDPWTVGFATSLALFAFALTTAWADARFLWSGQIFTSVTAAALLAKRDGGGATAR